MVAAVALPGAKIVALLIKTIAKPIAKRIKHDFSKNPVTANGLIYIGQAGHQVSSRLTIWSEGYKVRQIHPLPDDEALKNGSEVFAETFILGVSIGALVWEYNKSKEKEKLKESLLHEKATAERNQIQQTLYQLEQRLALLEQQQQQKQQQLDDDEAKQNNTTTTTTTTTQSKSLLHYVTLGIWGR